MRDNSWITPEVSVTNQLTNEEQKISPEIISNEFVFAPFRWSVWLTVRVKTTRQDKAMDQKVSDQVTTIC
jgi:hypothetical protein